jgi:hypothetical protein
MDIVQHIEKELYFLIAFLCGAYLGVIIGRRDRDDM